jgi:NTE family protein
MAKKLGLALGGGSARGIAHIGILKAFLDLQLPIDMIAGTSAGALVGGFFAAGLDPETMKENALALKWSDFASFHISRLGVVSSKPIEAFVHRQIGHVTFKQLKIPFAALATNILSGKGEVLNHPDLDVALAIKASASFPGVFEPTMINGVPYCDGGAVRNVPSRILKMMGADVVIAVDVIPRLPIDEVPTHMMGIVDRSLDILLFHMSDLYDSEADLVLTPLTKYFSSRHFKYAEQMIDMGFQAVVQNEVAIRKLLE